MYTHCPRCTADLGTNEVLEGFPVGRRLAFDHERGRLWALCPRCRSWNLAPIAERWEPVEAAERLFETARVGAATERMALGRVADGTELIRVGGADRRELAGWRYARHLENRLRKHRRTGMLLGGTAFLLAMTSLPTVPLLLAAGGVDAAARRWRGTRTRLEVPRGELDPLRLRVVELGGLRLLPDEGDAQWHLALHRFGSPPLVLPPEVRGRALRLALAQANHEVGKPRQVNRALERVLGFDTADELIGAAARTLDEGRAWESQLSGALAPRHRIRSADPVIRLALEIAANEDAENRALDGELAQLEREWAEAESLAAISDDLLLSPALLKRLRELKSAVRGETKDPNGGAGG